MVGRVNGDIAERCTAHFITTEKIGVVVLSRNPVDYNQMVAAYKGCTGDWRATNLKQPWKSTRLMSLPGTPNDHYDKMGRSMVPTGSIRTAELDMYVGTPKELEALAATYQQN